MGSRARTMFCLGLLFLSGVLPSCANVQDLTAEQPSDSPAFVPFTQELWRASGLDVADLEKLQFYVSEDIEFSAERLSANNPKIAGGELHWSHGVLMEGVHLGQLKGGVLIGADPEVTITSEPSPVIDSTSLVLKVSFERGSPAFCVLVAKTFLTALMRSFSSRIFKEILWNIVTANFT